MTEKLCRNCGEVKPLDSFYRHAAMADGHLNVCRACVRTRVGKHRRDNESVREYDRARSRNPDRVAARRAYALSRQDDPEIAAARAVSNAVRDGRLLKEPCLFCRSETGLEAHHRDYTKPLEVVWLCRRCHRRLHAKFPEQAVVQR